MAGLEAGSGFFGRIARKLRGQGASSIAPVELTPLSLLEQARHGWPDYCLYLRPIAGPTGSIEDQMRRAIHPLPVLTLEESGPSALLPDESLLELANAARLLWLVPTDKERVFARLRLIKQQGPIERCIFLMPEQGTLGTVDWPQTWTAARDRAAEIGIELSAYTAGGWLFRLAQDGKASTFRPIVNPNPEKIARAIEGICQEM
ncbi:MAG TPA: hypothetical protein VH370_17205 [Humisphaera sp.]|jgi:hypothetical protein|nr:hypothetical protein [Humisphaera sp.]